jgi:hypothetical protein
LGALVAAPLLKPSAAIRRREVERGPVAGLGLR